MMLLPAEAIEPPPEDILDTRRADFLEGVGRLEGRLITLLDLEKVLSDEYVAAAPATAADEAQVAASEPAATS
jgi:chemotaxis signal transduction protein